MEASNSMGGLIPLWILGAPLLAGLIALFTTPRSSTQNDLRDARLPQTAQRL